MGTSITENKERIGNFTSSQIYKLIKRDRKGEGFGAPALTYIREKNLERRLGRSLSIEKSTRALLWGKFLEKRVHDLLDTGFESVGNITVKHPTVDFWSGSPDNLNKRESIVGDTKCYEPKAFAEYVDCLAMGSIEVFKKEHEQEYWQLVSNAIIMGANKIMPIVYMPYESELEEIREMAELHDGADQWKYRFISESDKSELAYLPDGGYYKNLNCFIFEIPQADKDFLTERVLKAGRKLEDFQLKVLQEVKND